MARVAEESGFDSIWVGDHLLYRTPAGDKGPWEAWTLLSALAAVTERIELGPLVAATSFHNPAMIAKKAATLDEIAGGRLILGLGAGWNQAEYEAYGFPFDHRAARFEEALTIIRTLLTEGEIDFQGTYYRARNCVLVPRGPRLHGPPLMIGSMGQRVLSAALPHVAMWNAWYTWFGNRPEGLAPILDRVRRLCADQGRDPATLELTVAVLVQLEGHTFAARGYSVPEEVTPIRGDPSEVAGQLRTFGELGIGHLQLVTDPITTESIAALAPVLEQLR
jgi:probable F420-dependent oxidoreductase